MSFLTPKAILILKRDGFVLLSKSLPSPQELIFDKTAVENLEVKNPLKLENQIDSLIAQKSLKPLQLIIILADDLCFQKDLPADPAAQPKEIEQFLSEIPLEPQRIAYTAFHSQNKQFVTATNRDLFAQIAKTLAKHKWKIASVIPASIIAASGIEPVDPSSPHAVTAVFSHLKIIKHFDMLTYPKTTASEKTNPKRLTVIGTVILITAAALAIGFYVKDNLAKKSATSENLAVSPSPSSILEQIPEATEQAVHESSPQAKQDKTNLKIRIENGTGIAGQAATVGELLEALGYTNFQLGNAQTSNNQKTSVAFAADVDQDLRNEIVTTLEQSFETVTIDPGQSLDQIDILIITGNPI